MQKKMSVALVIIALLIFSTGCGTETHSKSLGLEIASHVDFNQEDYEKIVSANNELGFQIIRDVEDNEDGNAFISPTSLLMALSMVYNGAAGETKEEIAKAMAIEGIDVDDLNQANASLMTMLNKDSDHIQLNVANSIWLNEEFHFLDEFIQHNQDYFNAEVEEIDVLDRKSSKKINNWVKQSTNDKIEDIADDPLDSNLVAMLINAIYFKGDWVHAFDPKQTENRAFHLEDGTTKKVPTMKLNKELAYMENDLFQAITLPYGDGEMSMKVFLPKEDSSLEAVQQQLTEENWNTWNDSFDKKEGKLLLPRFQMEYEATLNETLDSLGMRHAFDRNKADFSNMIQEDVPLWISKVKQKTFVDVNEEGTEAAAVTSVEMKTVSAPIDQPFRMEVNRPYLIAITDDETNTILFIGSIFNP